MRLETHCHILTLKTQNSRLDLGLLTFDVGLDLGLACFDYMGREYKDLWHAKLRLSPTPARNL